MTDYVRKRPLLLAIIGWALRRCESGHAEDEAREDERNDEEEQQAKKELADRVRDLVGDERQRGCAGAEDAVERAADGGAEDQPEENLLMQCHACCAWYAS